MSLMRIFAVGMAFTSMGFQSNAQAETQQTPRSTIARQGEYVLKQLVSPDFDRLPLKRRIFAYYLSKAIDMGRDIAWTQASREGLSLRKLLEGMWRDSQFFKPQHRVALEEYYFRVLANHSNYDANANQKFVPEGITSEHFMTMARDADIAAHRAGRNSRYAEEATRLQAVIFDPNFQRQLHADAPGSDGLADSAADFYGPGVTTADVDAMPAVLRDHFLSYPVRNADGTVGVLFHRIGERFDLELRLIDFYLGRAAEFANQSEKDILAAHRKAMRTGDVSDVKAAETLWVQYKPTDIDFALGFIEVYGDPRGARGSWEGFVMMKNADPVALARIARIRELADEFEASNPYDDEFKKPAGSTPPQAEGAYLLHSGGDNGERPFAGVNLPNWRDINQVYGSKSFTAQNVMHEVGGTLSEVQNQERSVFLLPKYQAMAEKVNLRLIDDVQVEFHEILGHGSSQNRPGVTDASLKDYHSALEEGRAETASLYRLTDIAIRDRGILSKTMTDEEFQNFSEMAVVDFFTGHLKSYFKLSETTNQIRQAHQWGRQAMMNWLIHENALRIHLSDRQIPQVEVVSIQAVHESMGRFWKVIQKIKGTGQFEEAKAFLGEWGGYSETNRQWRASILKAMDELRLPRESLFLNPQWVVERDRLGSISNVALAYENGDHGMNALFAREQSRLREGEDSFRPECENALVMGPQLP